MDDILRYTRPIIFLLLVLSAFNVLASDIDNHVIELGGSTSINISPGTNVLVSDENIIKAKLLSNEKIILKAVSVGSTDVWLKHGAKSKKVLVTVVPSNKGVLKERVKALSAVEDGLHLEERNGLMVLSGSVSSKAYNLIKALAQGESNIMNLTSMQESEEPMLTLRVNILETKRQALEDIGIRWQGASEGPSISSAVSGLFDWELDIASQLMFMKRHGLAKLLANPTLSTQSGEKASFLAGGELPIPQVVAQGMQDVTFREYGIRLIVEPVVLKDGRIKTKLSAELSNIDPAVSVAGVPGILTRRTESVFLSEDGDTMVLSGLLNVDKSNQSDEMPGLGELPGLNRVFGSQQHREQTTELVVMVTAEKMSSADKRRLDKEQKREERNNWFKDESVLQLRELVHENTTSH